MSNVAILASFFWQATYSLAAPTKNTTTPVADPGWKKEPKGRGTFSIILTSVLTLALCVWTAIHPNVKPNASTWQKVKHKLLFVVIGMLAPEVVLAVAFYQWREARMFHKAWCELYGVEPGTKEDTLRMKGAFFVTMGGVSFLPVYKVPANFENILTANAYLQLARTNTNGKILEVEEFKKLCVAQRTTHTAAPGPAKMEGEVELTELTPDQSESDGGELGNLLDSARRGPGGLEQANEGQQQQEEDDEKLEMVIKKEFVHYREVQDKGKAEVLGKILVCLQALWMLVQCVVRKASGLPVTLLEIHVAMHVVCAVGMYGFWFNKPQDVGEPLSIPEYIIAGDDQMQLYMESLNNIIHFQHDNNRYFGRYQGHFLFFRSGSDDINEQAYSPSPTTNSVRFLGSRSYDFTLPDVRSLLRLPVPTPIYLSVPRGGYLDLGPIYITRSGGLWRTCVMPPEDLEFLRNVAKAYEAGKRPKWPRLNLLEYATAARLGDILGDIAISNVSPAILILLAYGGCHAAAWNTHFPSPMERLLWRISSILIAVVPAYAFYVVLLAGNSTAENVVTLYITRLYSYIYNRRNKLPAQSARRFLTTRLLNMIIITCVVVPIIAVLAGRLYLFVESFLSLRSLPSGSFDSTPWEDYFPHF